jgi:hypothetical protein
MFLSPQTIKIKAMKKIFLLSAIAVSGFIYNTANAQIGIHFGFRPHRILYPAAQVVVEQAPFYQQPAPAFDTTGDDYYYLPDVDAYYDVTDQCYFYFNGYNWISAAYLPGEYRDYDWRNAPRFEVRERQPYLHADFYRNRYNGHQIAEWSHPNYNNQYRGGYANQANRNGNYFNNREQRGYNQPAPQNRDNGQRFDNRGQGGYGQPEPQKRDNGQRFDNHGQQNNGRPSNQNSERDNRGGNEHFAQNKPQGGFGNHKMTKF